MQSLSANLESYEQAIEEKRNQKRNNKKSVPRSFSYLSYSTLSSNPSKVLSTLSTVTNHVTDLGSTCNEDPSTHVTDQVTNRVANHVTDIIESLNPMLRYGILIDDPEQTAENIVSATLLVKNATEDGMIAFIKGKRISELFPDVNLLPLVSQAFKRRGNLKVSESKTRMLLFVFDGVARELVPFEKMTIGNRSRLTYRELAVIAKTITHKILEGNMSIGSRIADVNNNYFLTKGFPKRYKTLTGRSIGKGRNKISAITNLLDEYGIITKVERWDSETKKRLRNQYKMGPNNPYACRMGQ